jgi:ribosomal protein S6
MEESTKYAKSEGNLIYEVGFNIIPSVSEEELPSLVTKITGAIETNGGKVINTESPRLKNLAYPMTKAGSGKKTYFESAYLGSVYFELSPEKISLVKKAMDAINDVLRFIILDIPVDALVAREKKIIIRDTIKPTVK